MCENERDKHSKHVSATKLLSDLLSDLSPVGGAFSVLATELLTQRDRDIVARTLTATGWILVEHNLLAIHL